MKIQIRKENEVEEYGLEMESGKWKVETYLAGRRQASMQ